MVSKQTKLIDDLLDKWEEHLEMYENDPHIVILLLAQELYRIKEENVYLRNRLR